MTTSKEDSDITAGKLDPTQIDPDYHPSQEHESIVRRGAQSGMPIDTMAFLLDTTPATVKAHYALIIAKTEQECVMQVADALLQKALEGHFPSMKFYLAARAGWIEKEKEQNSNNGFNPLRIVHPSKKNPDPAPENDE